jgi:hypothetical protein
MIGNRAVASNRTCCISLTYLGGELEEPSRETTGVEERRKKGW